jgi:hypothetical protein
VTAGIGEECGLQQSRIGTDSALDGVRHHSQAGKPTGSRYFEEGLVRVMGLGRKRESEDSNRVVIRDIRDTPHGGYTLGGMLGSGRV